MCQRLFLILVILFTFSIPASAEPDLSSLQVDRTPAQHVSDLIKRSNLIAYGWTDSAYQSVSTRRTVSAGKIVNYVQRFHIKRLFKGTSGRSVRLLSTGVEPLPDADNPINKTYPGPLGEGNYLLFLQTVKGTDLYSITGIWQGVYPLHEGRTIALEGDGFAELNGLTLDQIAQKLRSLQSRP